MTAAGSARPPVVWLDGDLVDPGVASVHWSDHGLTVGDGVFETVELRRGAGFAITRHLDRLDRSATGLGLVVPDRDEVRRAVDAVAAAWGAEPGRLRITFTAGPGPMGSDRLETPATLLVVATDLALQHEPVDVVVVPWPRNERGALAGLKTTSYAENVVALARARAHGAGEAIFANTRGELCEGTGSNIFVVLDGELITPPLDSGCLAGVTRALLLEALEAEGCAATQRPVAISRLGDAEEAFLVSTTRHVQPIRAVDGTVLDSCPGPLTRRAASVWVQRVRPVDDP